MAYTKRYGGGFVDLPSQTTGIDSQFLNAVETALLALYGSNPSTNQVMAWNGSTMVPKLLTTSNLSASAGILKTQLAALGIVDADVAVGAAIAATKLANGILPSQLSGYPSDASKFLNGGGTWTNPSTTSQLDYAQITANTATITATTEGTATAVITGNSVTYDGSAVMVNFWAPKVTVPAATTTVTYVVLRDSTVVGQVFGGSVTAAGAGGFNYVSVKDTPSAGAHTYKVTAFAGAAGGIIVNAGAGGSGNLVPAYLRVTRAA